MNSSTSCLNKLLPAFLWCWLLTACASTPTTALFESIVPDGPLIAVFPIENLSGNPAPMKVMHQELLTATQRAGARTVDPNRVAEFIERHVVRKLGSIDEATAMALRRETGADLVLLSSLELYNDQIPPKFALVSRLTETTAMPEIMWMDSTEVTGDEDPGPLGLTIIEDPAKLRAKGLERFRASLNQFLTNPPLRKHRVSAKSLREQKPFTVQTMVEQVNTNRQLLTDPQNSFWSWRPLLSRFYPTLWYSSRDVLLDQERTVAIIPFFDRSTRKHASELLSLHLAKQLVQDGSFKVLELGVIRDRLLEMHVVMTDGISLLDIDHIANALNIDLIIHGKIYDYLESGSYGSSPLSDFSLQIFERETKKILWSSHSHNRGDEGVYFYDWGQISNAGSLVDRMCQILVRKMVENAQ